MNLRPHKKPVRLQKRRGLRPLGLCQGWGLAELKKVDCTCYLKCPLKDPLPPPHLQQGIESIDQIASLCQSDLEAVRTAAREATLSFGKVWCSGAPEDFREVVPERPRPALQDAG